MYCPKCKTISLKPTKIENGLAGFSCPSCEGQLIEILSYRLWSENYTKSSQSNIEISKDIVESKKILVCPKCSKIMTKYQIVGDMPNKIDLCGNCGRFWLDGGEWALLARFDITKNITSIFNEPWQNKIKKMATKKLLNDRYVEILGEDEFKRLCDIHSWIESHPKKNEILDYLGNPEISWPRKK